VKKVNQFKAFLIVTGVVLLLATITLTMLFDRNNVVVRTFNDGINSIQNLFVSITDDVQNFGSRTFDFFDTHDENARLRREMYTIELAQITIHEQQREIDHLRQMLEIHETLNDFETIRAVVTGRDIHSWNDFLMLNQGEQHGVELDMAVVSAEGYLIGRITEVNQFSSRMHLIKPHNTDIRAHVQILGKDGSNSIFHGYDQSTNELLVTQIRRDVDVEIGDRVITTGLSGIFPRSLLAGYVVRYEIDSDGLTQNLFLTNNVNYDDLRFVFIIKRALEAPGQ